METARSSELSAAPSAVDAFAGSPDSNEAPTSPQAGEAVLRQNRPTSGDAAHDNPPQPEGNTISPESVDDSAHDFDFAAELGKSLAKEMESFTGPAYVPVKRALCRLGAAIMRETLIVLDDFASEAVESEHYNSNIDAPVAACGEGERESSVEFSTKEQSSSYRTGARPSDEFDAMFPDLQIAVDRGNGEAPLIERMADPRASFARHYSTFPEAAGFTFSDPTRSSSASAELFLVVAVFDGGESLVAAEVDEGAAAGCAKRFNKNSSSHTRVEVRRVTLEGLGVVKSGENNGVPKPKGLTTKPSDPGLMRLAGMGSVPMK